MPPPPADDPSLDDDDEENYNESSDEDFNPDAAVAADENVSSDGDSEDEPADASRQAGAGKKPTGKKPGQKKKPGVNEEAEDIGFENSGDEAIVKKGVKRKRRHRDGAAGAGSGDEDEGGRGGFVKTRRMRAEAAEEQARRPAMPSGPVTIDVDAVWQGMNDPNTAEETGLPGKDAPESGKAGQSQDHAGKGQGQSESAANATAQEADTVEIEETYKFAGELHKRKKLVPRASAEAQKWLKEHGHDAKGDGTGAVEDSAALAKAKRHPDTGEPLLRPLRRVSLWDPNPSGTVKGLPSNLLADTTAGNRLRVVDKSKLDWHTADGPKAARAPKATKLNVVEKSKMDWKAHVDETGDKDELQMAAKAKDSYLERRDFLERVGARKDEEERRARFK